MCSADSPSIRLGVNTHMETSSEIARPSLAKRVAYGSVVMAVCGLLVPGFASASTPPVTVPADPTGGQLSGSQGFLQTYVLTYAVPVLFGLALLGIGVRVGLRYMRRGGGSA